MSNYRILIVDDDPDLLFLVSHGVKSLGPNFQVNTAGDGPAALEQVRRQKFDLVVVDYMMPGMTGLELVEEIRRLAPNTEFILMTAHHDTQRLRDVVDEMAFGGFVSKPFTMPELLETVKQVVAQRPTSPVSNPADKPTGPLKERIQTRLQTLRQQIGAHTVLLVNSDGTPLYQAGDTAPAKIARLAAFVSANFLAVTELAHLFGDDDTVFKSSYYEGNRYHIYAHDINGSHFLAVVFGAGGKPGTVWFYTRQAVTELTPLLVAAQPRLEGRDEARLAAEFDDLLGNEGDSRL